MQNNLKKIRLKREMTQEDLSHLVGTNAGQINKLETGSRRLSDKWIPKLCLALNCTISELLGENSENNIPIVGEVPGGDVSEAINNTTGETLQFSSKKTNLFALRVKGNSMSRIAPDGMYVVVDPSDSDPHNLINKPVIVGFDMGGEYDCSFKIYKINPERFEPYSIEAGYDTIFPNGRRWKIYGRVIGAVGYIGESAEECAKLIPYKKSN